jgi:hypothetical protein
MVAMFSSSVTNTFALGSGSVNRPLELKYLEGNGALTLALPLPFYNRENSANSSLEAGPSMRVFSMQPNTSVGTFIAQVQQEDSSAKDVQVRTHKGVPFSPDTLFSALMADDFQIVLNDKVLRIAAPGLLSSLCAEPNPRECAECVFILSVHG